MENNFIIDLINRRNSSIGGGDTLRYLELFGATIVEPSEFEPDPNTHRSDYYYNASNNVLYKRISHGTGNDKVSHWKPISQI